MATDNNYYEIDLDIWKQYPVKNVTVKQLDIGRKIRVSLYSNGYKYNIIGSKITVYIKKDNKNIVFNNCKIIDINIIEIEITSSMVETAGRYNAEIDIISNGVSTFNFIFEVAKTNKDTINITQTSEYKALVELFKEMSNIDKKFIEVNTEISSFNNQLEEMVANVTNGNESVTNSEIVLARQGEKALSTNINKIKTNVKNILEEVFKKDLRLALSNDFLGEGIVSITDDNILNVSDVTSNYSYIYTNSEIIEFNIKNSSTIILGCNENWFTSLNLAKIGTASSGRLLKWYSNGYEVIAENVLSTEFTESDKAKIEITSEGYNIYKNDILVGNINKANYNNSAWATSKLGFFVKKDEGNEIFKNIKVLDYNISNIKDNINNIKSITNNITTINNTLLEIEDNSNYKNKVYEETKTTETDLISNYNANPLIENNILNCEQPNLTYNYVGIKTNRIKFTIKSVNFIALGKNGNNITGICLKSDNENYIGLLSDYMNQTLNIRGTLTFDSCQEDDEIIISFENNVYTFEKNGANWFTIDKNNYPEVECWNENFLGFMLTPTLYNNLAENIYHNVEKIIKIPVKEKVSELIEKVNSLNPSKFVGKKIAFLGDSITYGYGLADRTKAWCYILANLLGCTNFVNMGISGSTIANGSGDSALCKRYYMIDKDVDYIFVFAGTNDYGMYPTEIGIETDTEGTTFYGGLNKLIKGLMENYPKARIYFMTPLKRMCSKEFIDENDYHINTVGHNLNEYRQAIINRCEFYGVKVIDLYTKSGLNPSILSNRAEYFLDVVHTNEKGHEVIALTVQEEL